MDILTVPARAKVNLALAVAPAEGAGPRAGWHRIASWMSCIEFDGWIGDEVSVELVGDGPGVVEVAGDGVEIDWPVEKDLVFRAVHLIEGEIGRRLGVRVRVTKRVPTGGGLGGGSSDAAAAMRAVDEVCGLGIGVETLRAWSARLGSDIAFFLDEGVGVAEAPRPALVMGFGDEIERLDRVAGEFAVVCPPFGCPTGEVYAAFDAGGPGPMRGGEVGRLARSGDVFSAGLFNDLGSAAAVVRPGLVEIRDRLTGLVPGGLRVSGSGSTLIGRWPGDGASLTAVGRELGCRVERAVLVS